MKPLLYLRNAALFALALFLGSRCLDTLVPEPHFMRSELDYFSEHKDEFDVLFLGSSVLRRGVIPREFDARLSELGHEVKSFNLAIPGMRAHELNFFLEQILALKPARLRWIVMELDRFNPVIQEENQLAARMVYWHDLPQTLLALESVRLEQGPILEQLEAAKVHTVLFGAKLSHIGRGPDWFVELREGWHAQADEALIENQGWVPFSPDEVAGLGDSRVAENRRMLLDDPEWYAREVEALRESNQNLSSSEGFNFKAFEDRKARAQAAGVKLIHVLPPQLDLLPHIHQALEQGELQPTLDYHHPDRFPEFYRIEHHFDRNHLNLVGAQLWSRRLAEDFAARLDA